MYGDGIYCWKYEKGIVYETIICLIIGLMIVISAGCSKIATGDEKTAEIYIKSQGYEITARKGEIEHYIFEKSMLDRVPEGRLYQQVWGVQSVAPDVYFGKEISVYGFTVKNHPLETIYKQSDGTNVDIMLSEGQVIGGYSFPNADVLGAVDSVNGKTLEEVTGLSLLQWLNTIGAADTANTDILYKNNDFGFTLEIPTDFLDLVEINEGSDCFFFVDKEIQAMLPEHIFGVVGRLEIYDKKEYTRENLKEHEDAYGLSYLGENEKYYFGYAHATDVQVPPDDYQKFMERFRALEDRFDKIIQTFKLINTPEINSSPATDILDQF
jgi:hypothetical protein